MGPARQLDLRIVIVQDLDVANAVMARGHQYYKSGVIHELSTEPGRGV
jgi:hypothetical protein